MTINASDIFGIDVSLDVTNPTDPYLRIRLLNFQDDTNGGEITSGNGIDDVSLITIATLDEYASKIKFSIDAMHLQKQPAEDTDPTNGSYVEQGRKRFSTRTNVTQILHEYTTFYYTPDTSSDLDPDDIVTS